MVVIPNVEAVAALLAVSGDDELERLVLAHSPKFEALLDTSRRQIGETGGIPHERFWREATSPGREPTGPTERPRCRAKPRA